MDVPRTMGMTMSAVVAARTASARMIVAGMIVIRLRVAAMIVQT